MRKFSRLAVAISCLTSASAGLKAQEVLAPGTEVYAEHCAHCHGPKAATLAIKKMKLAPTGEVNLKSGRALSVFLTAHQVNDEQDRLDLVAYFKSLLKPKLG